ncbi:hypothetical protein DPMN_192397 [Dreissena polymorpha]|uniref:Uncharacterized protein n=1 Tax=Dreissena polymorpha TaxID=45954 RepID=A0A9D3Y0Z2_DREPO|nr:hypothetical protein DPMN_192397 [Dreissena polymorpha]
MKPTGPQQKRDGNRERERERERGGEREIERERYDKEKERDLSSIVGSIFCTLQIFKLGLYSIGTKVLTKFHEDLPINVTMKTAPPPHTHTGAMFFKKRDFFLIQPRYINYPTKLFEYWTVNVTSRGLTRFYYSYLRKIYRWRILF